MLALVLVASPGQLHWMELAGAGPGLAAAAAGGLAAAAAGGLAAAGVVRAYGDRCI